MKPALRIIFAPTFKRDPATHGKELYVHGAAQGRTIWIDPRSSEILDTLVHEICHINHPDWPEPMVQAYTKLWMKKSSWKRKAAYLKLLGSAIIEGEQ